MKENLISAREFCEKYNVEISFIHSLKDTGLIEITTIDETGYIMSSQLQELEKIIHLHYDLDINIEGIETINHLLERIKDLRDEITMLRNRLRIYEDISL